eukprot:365072-Chlamydomonas_euryale.AAC.22
MEEVVERVRRPTSEECPFCADAPVRQSVDAALLRKTQAPLRRSVWGADQGFAVEGLGSDAAQFRRTTGGDKRVARSFRQSSAATKRGKASRYRVNGSCGMNGGYRVNGRCGVNGSVVAPRVVDAGQREQQQVRRRVPQPSERAGSAGVSPRDADAGGRRAAAGVGVDVVGGACWYMCACVRLQACARGPPHKRSVSMRLWTGVWLVSTSPKGHS